MTKKEIIKKIKTRLSKKKMTARELATLTSINESKISMFLANKKTFSLDNFLKIAKALNIEIN